MIFEANAVEDVEVVADSVETLLRSVVQYWQKAVIQGNYSKLSRQQSKSIIYEEGHSSSRFHVSKDDNKFSNPFQKKVVYLSQC